MRVDSVIRELHEFKSAAIPLVTFRSFFTLQCCPFISLNIIFLGGEREEKNLMGFLTKCCRVGFVVGEELLWDVDGFVAGLSLSEG